MEARKAIEDVATECLDAEFLDTRGEFLDALESGGAAYLHTHFARVPRRVGTTHLPAKVISFGEIRLDLASVRTCDLLAADLLLHSAEPNRQATQLFRQGDAIERRMVLRALPFLPVDALVEALLLEAHRCNDEGLFDAALLDSNLPARLLATPDFNNLVLKAAFLGRPLARLFDASSRANPTLSRMLLDFMEERRAAGRSVWPDTFLLVSLAPTDDFHQILLLEAQTGTGDSSVQARVMVEALNLKGPAV